MKFPDNGKPLKIFKKFISNNEVSDKRKENKTVTLLIKSNNTFYKNFYPPMFCIRYQVGKSHIVHISE